MKDVFAINICAYGAAEVAETCVVKGIRLASPSHLASARWNGTVHCRRTVSTVSCYEAVETVRNNFSDHAHLAEARCE